jgi:hypothetical protein
MTSTSPQPKHTSLPHMYARSGCRVSSSRVLSLCLKAQYEALQNTLKNVKQEPVQTNTSLFETKRMFENAREGWQIDKKTRSRDGRRRPAHSASRRRGDTAIFSADGDFDSSGPDVSTSQPFEAPNHPSNEVEPLQQCLAHGQRQINTPKSTAQGKK